VNLKSENIIDIYLTLENLYAKNVNVRRNHLTLTFYFYIIEIGINILDLLTEINGKTIYYDTIGNPTKWRDWAGLVWELDAVSPF